MEQKNRSVLSAGILMLLAILFVTLTILSSVFLKGMRFDLTENGVYTLSDGTRNILKNMDTMIRERLMLRHHHERFDGLGYPDRLAGEDIPFEARIVCVADAIDAMTTHRVYRMARPLSFCVEQLQAGSGTQFDPEVVKVAIAAIERGVVSTQAEEQENVEGVMPLSALITVKTEVRNYG